MTGEWAVITLATGKPGANFTENPHFTIFLGPDYADIELTLPNCASSKAWTRQASLAEIAFCASVLAREPALLGLEALNLADVEAQLLGEVLGVRRSTPTSPPLKAGSF
jgi:hypothetical protein